MQLEVAAIEDAPPLDLDQEHVGVKARMIGQDGGTRNAPRTKDLPLAQVERYRPRSWRPRRAVMAISFADASPVMTPHPADSSLIKPQWFWWGWQISTVALPNRSRDCGSSPRADGGASSGRPASRIRRSPEEARISMQVPPISAVPR